VIRVVRLGTARARDEGPRLGTVRRPPRGVPKSRFAKDNWYDVWLPMLSPSAPLVAQALHGGSWSTFVRRYRAEMKRPDAAHVLDTLAALSHSTNFSVGCYCEDEKRCHRSVLRVLLEEHGANVT
jgi:uncharacterized protein YeaO (DUF488 family)